MELYKQEEEERQRLENAMKERIAKRKQELAAKKELTEQEQMEIFKQEEEERQRAERAMRERIEKRKQELAAKRGNHQYFDNTNSEYFIDVFEIYLMNRTRRT
jgi:exonuclease VII large subunit